MSGWALFSAGASVCPGRGDEFRRIRACVFVPTPCVVRAFRFPFGARRMGSAGRRFCVEAFVAAHSLRARGN